jgi:hypothetical protein
MNKLYDKYRPDYGTIQCENKTVINKDTPHPTYHRNVSFVKSLFRIIAGGCIIYNIFILAGVFLIFAELLGIIEELV